MNFREAKNQIISITKRPDKDTDIGDNINEAISMAALRNFFADLFETTIPITSTEFIHRLDLTNTTYWNRFRKIKYIRPSGYRTFLEWKDPTETYKKGFAIQDVWYRAGNGIIISLSKYQSSLEVGYFRYHETLIQDGSTDWMLDTIWPFIKEYACYKTFMSIGDVEEANRRRISAFALLDGFATDLADGASRG